MMHRLFFYALTTLNGKDNHAFNRKMAVHNRKLPITFV